MDTKTTIQLLEEVSVEVRSLRRSNELMAARLQVFDSMILIFQTQPQYQGRGMSEDVVYKIEKHIESAKLEA